MESFFAGTPGSSNISILTSLEAVWRAARALLEATLESDGNIGAVLFADLRDAPTPAALPAGEMEQRERFDATLDQLVQRNAQPVHHILKQPVNGHAAEIVSAILLRNRRCVSYHVYFLQAPQTGFQVGCFVENVGAVLAYSTEPNACFAVKIALQEADARYEVGLRAYFRQALHMVEAPDTGEPRKVNPSRPVEVMRYYDYFSQDWWRQIAGLLKDTSYIIVKQTKPSMLTLEGHDLAYYIQQEYPQTQLMGSGTGETVEANQGDLPISVMTMGEATKVREIFDISAIEGAVLHFERQRDARAAAGASTPDGPREADMLLRSLRWIVAALRKRPERYECGLTTDTFNQAFLVGVQKQGVVRVLSEMRTTDSAKIGLEFPDVAPVALITQSLFQALQNEWLQIPADQRSDTIDGRRAIISFLSALMQRLENALALQGQGSLRDDSSLSADVVPVGRTEFSARMGATWLTSMTGMLRLQHNLAYMGRQPSELLCNADLFALRFRWMLDVFGGKTTAAEQFHHQFGPLYDQLQHAFLNHQLSGHSIREVWDKKGIMRYVRGFGLRRRETLPHPLVLEHILAIIKRVITDPLYQVRLLQQDFAQETWVNEQPAVKRSQDAIALHGNLGQIERDTYLAREEWSRFEGLWASAAPETSSDISRHLLDMVLQYHNVKETMPFLVEALPYVGMAPEQFVDVALAQERLASDRQEWRVLVSELPGVTTLMDQVAVLPERHEALSHLFALTGVHRLRVAQFLQALRRGAPIRILSSQADLLRWFEEPHAATPSDPFAHVERARDFLKILGGYPNIHWRLRLASDALNYEVLGQRAVLLEVRYRDHADDLAARLAWTAPEPRMGYYSEQAEIVEAFALHFDEEWDQAMSDESRLGWLFQQIARHTPL